MRRNRSALRLVGLLLIALGTLAAPSSPTASAYTRLPVDVSQTTVDHARRRFLVAPADDSRILVYDYFGHLVDTLAVPDSRTRMSMHGDELFVSSVRGNSIHQFDLTTLEEVTSWPVEPVSTPDSLTRIGDYIWFSYCEDGVGLASLHIPTGLVRDHGPADNSFICMEVDDIPSEPNHLLTWNRTTTETTITVFDVTTGIPVQLRQMTVLGDRLDVAPDGSTFLVEYEGDVQRFRTADFVPLERYAVPGREVIAIDQADDGTVAIDAFREEGGPNIHVFPAQAARPDFTASAPRSLSSSLAITPDAKRVFSGERPRLATMMIPTPVRTGGGFEWLPSANSRYSAWNQASSYTSSRSRIRYIGEYGVEQIPYQAYMGEVDGKKLVYQAVFGRESDIFIRDMDYPLDRRLPAPIKTSQWEYLPSYSDGRVLFARVDRRGRHRRLFVTDVSSRRSMRLDQTRRGSLTPGHINGHYATWSKCDPKCDVYRYDLKTRRKTKIPNPGRITSFGPSVTSDGTVYFGRGGPDCGRAIRVMKFANGRLSTLSDLSAGKDFFTTAVYEDSEGTHVLYDELTCAGKEADIFEIMD